ncbi:aldose 1-epimerase [Palleronia marisminoris]|uniref:aldose epimerase family protein n=1 Tax=Palleronia marisminoris TaxID=315423 RepID=UPI001587B89C|nr:aldose 1-epimerase [Palleronia marisminoris]
MTPAHPFAGSAVERHVLRNDRWEAALLPAAGGRLQRLRHVDHGDLLVPLLTSSPNLDAWPKAGAFPLFPFHNRLRGGAILIGDRRIRLRPNTANGEDVMHGPAHRRPWSVSDKGPDFIEMTLDYRPDADWPFAFQAVQRLTLRKTDITVALFLRNTGETLMPGGMGWHTYLKPPPDGLVRIEACSEWVMNGPGGLPSRARYKESGTDRIVESDTVQHLSDWTQAGTRIGDGARLAITADCGLAHLVVHRKPGYLCLEPVSHVAGALATLPMPNANSGLRLLEPGALMTGTLTLRIEDRAPLQTGDRTLSTSTDAPRQLDPDGSVALLGGWPEC